MGMIKIMATIFGSFPAPCRPCISLVGSKSVKESGEMGDIFSDIDGDMEIYGIYNQHEPTKRDVWVKIPSGNLVQFSMEAMMAQITSGYLGSMFEHGGYP